MIEARARQDRREAQKAFASFGASNPNSKTNPGPTHGPGGEFRTGSRAQDEAGQGQWPDPEPLEAGLLEVIPFDPDALLPESIRPWVVDMAEQMQAPIDYLGTTAMIGLGSALGRRIAIRPTRFGEWFEVPNLWGMAAGPPGMMKSPAMNAALKPLRRLEERAQEQASSFARTTNARPRYTNGARRRRKR